MATTEQLANTTQKEPVIDLDQDSNMEIAHKIQNQTKRLPISEPANKNKTLDVTSKQNKETNRKTFEKSKRMATSTIQDRVLRTQKTRKDKESTTEKVNAILKKSAKQIKVREEEEGDDDLEDELTLYPSKRKMMVGSKNRKRTIKPNRDTIAEEQETDGEHGVKQRAFDPKQRHRQCPECLLLFSTPDKLKRHMKSHGDVPDVYCSLCNTPIKFKYNLRVHLEKCYDKMKLSLHDSMLSKVYPDFVRKLQEAAKNPVLPMPTLEGMPYEFTLKGVVGFDTSLDITKDLMLAKYEQKKQRELAGIDSDDSDELDYFDDFPDE